MDLKGDMGVVSIFLGINLYVALVALMHKIFSDKHGNVKAFIFGNLVILATLILVFLIPF